MLLAKEHAKQEVYLKEHHTGNSFELEYVCFTILMYRTSQKLYPKDNTVDKLKLSSAQGGNSITYFW